MGLKKIFGATLTTLGMAGIVYAAIIFIYNTSGTQNIKTTITFAIIGIIFFSAGIGLIRSTKDYFKQTK
jgi:uncharacterized membrane protein